MSISSANAAAEISAAGKNAVLNGDFGIWQRGTTSASITTAATYAADRWASVSGASTAMVVSRQATGDTTNLPNIQYCSRVQKTAGQTGTSVLYFAQSIESINSIPFAGKTVTLSFYARKGANYSSATSVVSAYVQTGTGTDQNILSGGFTGSVNAIAQDSTLTTTWQRFTYTGTIGTTATQIGMFFSYTPVGTAGAADYFEITGVQLEVGAAPTSFLTATGNAQGELAACQRYYFRTAGASGGGGFACTGFGMALSSTSIRSWHVLPVLMRTAASMSRGGNMTFYGIGGGLQSTAFSAGYSSAVANGVMIDWTVAGATANYGYVIYVENSANNFLEFSAEL